MGDQQPNSNLPQVKQELSLITRRAKTFIDVFKSENKVISSPVYDKAELALYINKVCFAWLNINSPSPDNAGYSRQFTDVIMETRLDWKPEDIELFFKTVISRQDLDDFKIMGNRITAVKLCSMLPQYEELRAIERENHYKTTYKPEITEKGNVDYQKYTKKILKRLNTNKYEYAPVGRTDKAQEWIRDFDKLYNERLKTDPLCEEEKMRFVIIDGGKMGLDDYLKYRLGK